MSENIMFNSICWNELFAHKRKTKKINYVELHEPNLSTFVFDEKMLKMTCLQLKVLFESLNISIPS